jgi:uncharacterized protein (TIGR03000 family)
MTKYWLSLLGGPTAALVMLVAPGYTAAQHHPGGGGHAERGHAEHHGAGTAPAIHANPSYGAWTGGSANWNRGWYGYRDRDWDRRFYGWYPYRRFYGYWPYSSYGYYPYTNYWSDYGSYPDYSYFGTYPNYDQGYYSDDQAPAYSGQQDNSVALDIRVPANAQVWIEGQQTSQGGSLRRFVSPPLTTDKDYTYEVRAQWMENGRPVDQVREVTVHAGEQLTVDFMQPQQGG